MRILNLPLDPGKQNQCALIGANDRGFIPGLACALMDVYPAPDAAEHRLEELKRWRREDLCRIVNRGRPPGVDIFTHPTPDAVAAMERDIEDAVETVRQLDASGKLIVLGTGRGRDGDPSLILVHAPDKLRYTLLDAIYRWRCDKGGSADQTLKALAAGLDIVAVFHDTDKPERVVQVEFSGHRRWVPVIVELIGALAKPPVETARLTLFSGGSDSVFFGAAGTAPGDARLLESVADTLLDNLLIGNRPVLAWRTHFFQALQIETLDRCGLTWPMGAAVLEKLGAQERGYFMPFLHKFIAPEPAANQDEERKQVRGDGVLASIELPAARPLRLEVRYDDGTAPQTLEIEAMRLHLFFNQTVMIEWEVSQDCPGPKSSGHIWRDLLDRPRNEAAPTLARVVDFNAAARMAFSTYATTDPSARYRIALLEPRDDGDAADWRELGVLAYGWEASAPPITGWFLALLNRALPKLGIPQTQITLLWDDRSRVLSSVVAAGEQPVLPSARKAMDVVLARLQTVDRFETGHASDARFARAELAAGLYGRYLEWGSSYAASSHSFVFVGYGGFSREHIHLNHMRTMYRRMFLLVMFYSAILSDYAQQLTTTDFELEASKFALLRRGYLNFTNRLWFRQVSSQIQGIELFNLMWTQSWIEREYLQIKAEIEQSDQFRRLEADERQARFVKGASIVGVTAVVSAGVEQFGSIGARSGWPGVTWWIVLVMLSGLVFGVPWLAAYMQRHLSVLSRRVTAARSRHRAVFRDSIWPTRLVAAGRVVRSLFSRR